MLWLGGRGRRSPQPWIGGLLIGQRAIRQLPCSEPARMDSARRVGDASILGSLLTVLILVSGLSGCMTTLDLMQNRSGHSSISRSMGADQDLAESTTDTILAGHQSIGVNPGDIARSASQDLDIPPPPDSKPPEIAGNSPDEFPFDMARTDPSSDQLASSSQLGADPAIAQPGAIDGEQRQFRRLAAAQVPVIGRATFSETPRSVDAVFGDASSILRDREIRSSDADENGQFNYPDIHQNPAKIYHERFGTKEEHDPFLLPWIVNLIYEDRWLLAEPDPAKAIRNQLERRLKIDIRDPDPDLANFPNGAYTIPKGRFYIENSPLGLYRGSSNGMTPAIYQWEYLIRYGLTDNLEFRVFSNGLTDQEAIANKPGVVGYQPLAIDFKANFWEENTKYHVPAMGIEVYLQTKLLGSSAFNSGTQPSISILFDQSLPYDIGFEYNFGYTGVENSRGEIAYQFSYQWSLQREVVKDFDLFLHGFYNAAALPRLNQFQTVSSSAIPDVTVIGAGGIWTVNDRLAVFGSYNFGVTPSAPQSFGLLGFAFAL